MNKLLPSWPESPSWWVRISSISGQTKACLIHTLVTLYHMHVVCVFKMRIWLRQVLHISIQLRLTCTTTLCCISICILQKRKAAGNKRRPGQLVGSQVPTVATPGVQRAKKNWLFDDDLSGHTNDPVVINKPGMNFIFQLAFADLANSFHLLDKVNGNYCLMLFIKISRVTLLLVY